MAEEVTKCFHGIPEHGDCMWCTIIRRQAEDGPLIDPARPALPPDTLWGKLKTVLGIRSSEETQREAAAALQMAAIEEIQRSELARGL